MSDDVREIRQSPAKDVDLWTRAADAMREDDDPRWHAVGDWLRLEVVTRANIEPLTELMNLTFEQTCGVKGYLRLKRRPDGSVEYEVDTSEAATAVALRYLREERA